MNKRSNYNNSEDLLDNSSFLSIYDDVLFSHTMGDYESSDLFSLDDDNDLFSLDDASVFSVLSQRANIPQVKVILNKDSHHASSEYMKPNPRRWETVKPVIPTNGLKNLVSLDDNFNNFDDLSDNGLSIESKAGLPLLASKFSPHHSTSGGNYGEKMRQLSSRIQITQIFPSYKDILTSKYFLG